MTVDNSRRQARNSKSVPISHLDRPSEGTRSYERARSTISAFSNPYPHSPPIQQMNHFSISYSHRDKDVMVLLQANDSKVQLFD